MSKTTWHDRKLNISLGCGGPECSSRHGTNCDLHPGVTRGSAEARYEFVKREDWYLNSKTEVAGPTVGASANARYRCSKDHALGVGLEVSLAKAKLTSGQIFAEANLNANTGFELGTRGGRINVAGFGGHFGSGGRYSLDTPLGSLGFNF